MTLLVFAKDRGQFEEFKRWQWRPDDFVFADDEVGIMRQAGKKLEAIMLPNFLENAEYRRITNLKQLIARVRKT